MKYDNSAKALNALQKELARYSPVPVLNALSSLWHPTQILADLLTLHEHAHLFSPDVPAPDTGLEGKGAYKPLPTLRPLTITWLGDSTNVLHDMLVTYPRFGHKASIQQTLACASLMTRLLQVRVATPAPPAYQCPAPVWDRVKELGCDKDIWWGSDPREAVHGADVIVTDTW